MSTPQNVLLKLLLIGDMGVGKSSLLFRYIDRDFSDTYISTIGVDFKVRTVTLDDRIVKLQIWDTAGQDRFRTITSTYYRGAHGIIIVYDVNDVRTFVNVERWTEEAKQYANEAIARILVGNKNENSETKVVTAHDAQRLAAKHTCLFIETSAKKDENVDEMFDMITREALRLRLLANEQQSPSSHSEGVTLQPVSESTTKPRGNCCGKNQ